MKKLIVVGDSALAQIAFEYFTHDSDYEVSAFAVERAYLCRDSLFERPVIPLEDIQSLFPPSDHSAFVAVSYGQLNRLRTRLCGVVRGMGYSLASYVSSRAFVWKNSKLGEHCFIFEDNTIQPFVTIGSNCILWSGNHIGHHSSIGDNCFISSHVVVSGYVEVGEFCFLGVNSTIANNIKIARDNWIGPGVTITKDTQAGELYPGTHGEPSRVSALRMFKVKEPQ
jgi:sugar O-acyltransferase (sialic acid O-acetyltransferase NeuD family)